GWGVGLSVVLMVGVMVAARELVGVVAVFRKLRVPDRLVNLVEAESLLNDGTGVILFSLALAATDSGSHGPLVGWAAEFLRLAAGGGGVGGVVGFGGSLVGAGVVIVPGRLALYAKHACQ